MNVTVMYMVRPLFIVYHVLTFGNTPAIDSNIARVIVLIVLMVLLDKESISAFRIEFQRYIFCYITAIESILPKQTQYLDHQTLNPKTNSQSLVNQFCGHFTSR